MARIPKYIREELRNSWENKRSTERCALVKSKFENFKTAHSEEYAELNSIKEEMAPLEARASEIKATLSKAKEEAGLVGIEYPNRYGSCDTTNQDSEILDFDIHTIKIKTEIMTTDKLDSSKYLN